MPLPWMHLSLPPARGSQKKGGVLRWAGPLHLLVALRSRTRGPSTTKSHCSLNWESPAKLPKAAGDTYHLVVVVTVGDVGLLEKSAEGRLWEEKPKLTLSTLPSFPGSLGLGTALGLATEWER